MSILRAERLSFDSRQHHKGTSALVDVLLGSIPLLPYPFLVEQQLVEVIGQSSGRESPGTIETGAGVIVRHTQQAHYAELTGQCGIVREREHRPERQSPGH